MNSEFIESRYLKVRDNAGNEFVCPMDEFDGNNRGLIDSENCVESEVVGRYGGRLKIIDTVR